MSLFCPTGPEELALVAATGWKRWPPRLPGQPFFYPVTHEAYAREITERWNLKESGTGFVTRFALKKTFLDRYDRHVVGAREHEEYWIPAEHLDALNDSIVGSVEVTGVYGLRVTETSVETLLLPNSAIEFGGERPEVPSDLDGLSLIAAALLAASFVSAISEDYWCAGWLTGIGADSYLWAKSTSPVRFGSGTLGDADVATLARLRTRLDPWWVDWLDCPGGVALVRAASFAARQPATR